MNSQVANKQQARAARSTVALVAILSAAFGITSTIVSYELCALFNVVIVDYIWAAIPFITFPIFFALLKRLALSSPRNISAKKKIFTHDTVPEQTDLTSFTTPPGQTNITNFMANTKLPEQTEILINSFAEVERAALLAFIRYLESNNMVIAAKSTNGNVNDIYAICISNEELLDKYFKFIEESM